MESSGISCELIQQKIAQVMPSAKISVSTDGYYYSIDVENSDFIGMSIVKRQQKVYEGINEMIASGDLHAVKISTSIPTN